MDILGPREISVKPNSCRIAQAYGHLVARDLFSDLLLVIYAEEAKFGMMLRIEDGPDHLRFAESALQMLLFELPSLGIDKKKLTVHAIGGVGRKAGCLISLECLLSSEEVFLTGADLGDEQCRSVWLALESGRLIVRSSKTSGLARSSTASTERLAS